LDWNIGIAGTLLLIPTVSGADCDDELLNAATKGVLGELVVTITEFALKTVVSLIYTMTEILRKAAKEHGIFIERCPCRRNRGQSEKANRYCSATCKPNLGIHLCGDATHHFKFLKEHLRVNSFDTGFPVDHGELRQELGTEVQMTGGATVMKQGKFMVFTVESFSFSQI